MEKPGSWVCSICYLVPYDCWCHCGWKAGLNLCCFSCCYRVLCWYGHCCSRKREPKSAAGTNRLLPFFPFIEVVVWGLELWTLSLLLLPYLLGLWAQSGQPRNWGYRRHPCSSFPLLPLCISIHPPSDALTSQDVDLSGILVCWADEPFLGCRCPTSCRLKDRDKGINLTLSWCWCHLYHIFFINSSTD